MINRTMIGDDFLGLDSSMKVPVITSSALHIALFILTAVGLPFIVREPEIFTPIAVEIVTPDQVTQTNRVAEPKPPEPKKEELLPPQQEKPSPPKVDLEQPPEITKPKPPVEEVKAPPVEELAPPKPEKKKEPVKPKEKPKPPEKKKEVTKKEKEEAAQQDFASLLKNLTPDTKQEQPEKTENPAKDATVDTAIAPMADTLTASERMRISNHYRPCWSIQGGAKNAETLIVPIDVVIGRDRVVQSATIVEQVRYNLDSHYRAAADAAMRAINSPNCKTPLPLPADKYSEWNRLRLKFDPSEMLR